MHSAKRMKLNDYFPNKSSPPKAKRMTKPEKAMANGNTVDAFEDEKSNFRFLDLNDASIQLILDKLTLNEIIAMALTCKRLFGLSHKWFFDAYPYQAQEVDDIEARSGILKFPGCEKYVAVFSRINKVSLGASMGQSMENVMQYLQNKSLTEIRFGYWRPMRASHLKKVSGMFERTNTVIFTDMKFAKEPYKLILQHMPAMERLEIWKNLNIAGDDKNEWLHQTYPNLKHFAWYMKADLNIAEMVKLFEANPQIERFSLLSNNMEAVNSCTEAGINITELFLKIEDNLILTLIELNKFCANDNKKRLHLFIADKCREELSKNLKMMTALSKNIDGLYFNKTAVEKPLITAINQIGHLKCLQLRPSKLANTFELQRLEEVWLPEKKFGNIGDNVLEVLESFAAHSPTLKKIHFRNNANLFTAFDFEALDAARQKLHGVPKIAVYVDSSVINSSRFAEIEQDYSTLYIKAIEIEDIDNPLMNEFTKLKVTNGKR